MPQTHVALMRGINVGGKNKLPMKDLAALFVEAGCQGVRTFIQSGNVVFTAEPGLASQIPALIAGQIEKRHGLRTPVVLRTLKQMGNVLGDNPFLKDGSPEETLHVMFLADVPDKRKIKDLDQGRSPPDSFIVKGSEIYLRLPNGAAKTKLTNAYFDSKLATVSTGRNWRTVTKLIELMKE
jgi:uncharacterized protein (DUF1697 family)